MCEVTQNMRLGEFRTRQSICFERSFDCLKSSIHSLSIYKRQLSSNIFMLNFLVLARSGYFTLNVLHNLLNDLFISSMRQYN